LNPQNDNTSSVKGSLGKGCYWGRAPGQGRGLPALPSVGGKYQYPFTRRQ